MQGVNGKEIIISLFVGDGKWERSTTKYTGVLEPILIVHFLTNPLNLTLVIYLCCHVCQMSFQGGPKICVKERLGESPSVGEFLPRQLTSCIKS